MIGLCTTPKSEYLKKKVLLDFHIANIGRRMRERNRTTIYANPENISKHTLSKAWRFLLVCGDVCVIELRKYVSV